MEHAERPSPRQFADDRVAAIMRAAASWAREGPAALEPAIRAVCVRLSEMVADQRHYLAPLPEPQESERRAALDLVAEQLRASRLSGDIESHLAALEERELRATGSWAIVASAQSEWVTTAIQYLQDCSARLPAADRPDPYWADDVVAGIIASARALIGIDELHARTESQFPGGPRRDAPGPG
ncbi:MAG: hypothetical protein MUC69_00805 [Gemmatimonadales bacterium]|jgi:hypothetical protein|nr:hypothetical protein [Gemmatimonadales bacterium]